MSLVKNDTEFPSQYRSGICRFFLQLLISKVHSTAARESDNSVGDNRDNATTEITCIGASDASDGN